MSTSIKPFKMFYLIVSLHHIRSACSHRWSALVVGASQRRWAEASGTGLLSNTPEPAEKSTTLRSSLSDLLQLFTVTRPMCTWSEMSALLRWNRALQTCMRLQTSGCRRTLQQTAGDQRERGGPETLREWIKHAHHLTHNREPPHWQTNSTAWLKPTYPRQLVFVLERIVQPYYAHILFA